MLSKSIKKQLIILTICILSLSSIFLYCHWHLLRELLIPIENKVLDLCFQFRGNKADEQNCIDAITIVDIDETSIDKLGQFSRWPNSFFASAVEYIASSSPVAMGFDIFFTESDSMSSIAIRQLVQSVQKNKNIPSNQIESILKETSTDYLLAEALQKVGCTYLSMFDNLSNSISHKLPNNLIPLNIENKPTQSIILNNPKSPLPLLSDAAYRVGFAHIVPDRDGIVRNYPLFFRYKDRYYANFSFQVMLDLLQIKTITQAKAISYFTVSERNIRNSYRL